MVKTAIILAPDDKGMEPVFGMPVTRRLVLLLTRLGFSNIHMVGQVTAFIPVLSDLIPARSFHTVGKDEPLEQVLRELGVLNEEKVMVLKANHVADKHSLANFLRCGDDTAVCRLDVTGPGETNNGLYLVDHCNLVPIIRALWSPNGHGAAVLDDITRFRSVNGLPYIIEARATDAKVSEEKLVGALSAQTMADDGFIARHFDRKISRFISKRLAHTSILPNQITIAGMTMGLIGALLLSEPGYWSKLIGSLLFVLCVIVDGVDGEVARLKLKESTFGHYLDIVTDNLVHVAIFVGIAFGLYHDTGNPEYLSFLWFLVGGFFLCIVAVYQCILRLDPDTLSRSPRTLRLMALVTNRDFAYLVLALAIIGRLNWFLIGASVGTYLFAIGLWIIGFYERRMRSSATKI